MALRTLLFLIAVSITAAARLRNVHKALMDPPKVAPSSYAGLKAKVGLADEVDSKGDAFTRKLVVLGVKQGISLLVPYEMVSAVIAKEKADALRKVAQKMKGPDYDGDENKDITTLKQAIQFVVGKKLKKYEVKKTVGSAKAAVITAGLVTGATAGNVIAPVVGTAPGLLAGLAMSCVINPLITLTDSLRRGCNLAYKTYLGTQGKHRQQAATVLWVHAFEKKEDIAKEALQTIFGVAAQEKFFFLLANKFSDGSKNPKGKDSPEFKTAWIGYIAGRLKSV